MKGSLCYNALGFQISSLNLPHTVDMNTQRVIQQVFFPVRLRKVQTCVLIYITVFAILSLIEMNAESMIVRSLEHSGSLTDKVV